MVMGIFLSDLQ